MTKGFPGEICLPVQETCSILGQEDPLEKEMTTHSSIFVWEIPWPADSGGLPFMASQSQTGLKQLNNNKLLAQFDLLKPNNTSGII